VVEEQVEVSVLEAITHTVLDRVVVVVGYFLLLLLVL
jgi:hypothetical protein